ncbi:hypothetical protein QBC34DRAFT_384156 [Podospora aff. communis PSN243]|uniref:MARVEL domain-containing protein n=1 Tax=Podospora aff. communis PSN243 TaxID=3040156 RepID=A0AAV9GEE6_9PEZI|nr:hypothetical protein QBC34DRAFT_384156 [Podospora aff. communis PSN243]
MPLTPLSLPPSAPSHSSTRSPLWTSLISPLYIWRSFRITSPFTPLRILARLSMWVILLMRFVASVASIYLHGFGGYKTSMVFGSIFAVLGFFVVAAWLAVVGCAEGRRRVWGVEWGRKQFDWVLVALMLCHLAIFLIAVYLLPKWALTFLWFVLLLAIFVFAYIAARPSRAAPGEDV